MIHTVSIRPGIGTFGPRSVELARQQVFASRDPFDIKAARLRAIREESRVFVPPGKDLGTISTRGGSGMGFLDSIFDVVAPLVSTFIPGGGLIAAAGRAAGLGSQPVRAAPIPNIGGTALGGVIPARAGAAALAAQAAPAGAALSIGGGNGQVSVMTIVQTIDNATGAVIRTKTLRGSPFLMNNDIAVAKRVFRTVGKLSGRLPKKIVKQSEASKLKDEIQDAAFHAIRSGVSHGGHHLVPACPS